MTVTAEESVRAARTIGLNILPDHEDDYLKVLGKTYTSCKIIMEQPGEFLLPSSVSIRPCSWVDYITEPLLDRFPRANIHLPTSADNPLRGWAWRAEAGDPVDPKSDKVLSGKTVVLKDTICMANVPLMFGTNAFEDFTREP